MKTRVLGAILLLLIVFNIVSVPSDREVSSAVRLRRFDFFSNAGGLNDAFSPIEVKDNEATDLQNVVFTTSGNWKTRDGFTKINSSNLGTTVVCTGLKFYQTSGGNKFLVGIFDDDTIRKMDYASGGAADGTWDDITGSLSFSVGQNDLASFTIGEDALIIEDGLNTTAPYMWHGNVLDIVDNLSGSPPNATMVAFHKNMGFAAGDGDNPSTLYFSDLGDIKNWTTGLSGNVDVDTNDGTVIKAIVPGFDALYIWKGGSSGRGSLWRLSGDDKDSFKLQRMVSDIGTLSHQSVAIIGNDFFFMDAQGDIYIYDGAVKVRKISTKIEGTLNDANFARFQYAVATVFDEDYYISLSGAGSGTHNQLLVFDTFNLAWSKFKGINANALTVFDNGSGQDLLAFGVYHGIAYQYPDGINDDGSAIDMFYQAKQYRFPDMTPEKDLKILKVFANQKGNYNLTTEIRTDFESTGLSEDINLLGETSIYGTAVYGTDRYGGQNLIIGRIEPYKEGQFFQIRYSNSNVDEPIQVKGWQLFLEDIDRY